MLKHIVMFKLKEFENQQVKEEKALLLKKELDALPQLISKILFYEVGINIFKTNVLYDIVVISFFDSLESLNRYKIHKEHLRVLELINQLTEQRAAVDYMTD